MVIVVIRVVSLEIRIKSINNVVSMMISVVIKMLSGNL